MLFSCLGFVLFGWLSAVYVVFPACTIPSYLLLELKYAVLMISCFKTGNN